MQPVVQTTRHVREGPSRLYNVLRNVNATLETDEKSHNYGYADGNGSGVSE
jgi:hypothetical protein